MARRRSRSILMLVAALLVAGGLAYAFWPRPMLVDIGTVTVEPMRLTINEEGRTRVHDAYTVSTPVAGRLLRVEVHPGDQVVEGETVVARMLPTNPAALDIRTREQARALVAAAEAALRVARADLAKATADRDLSQLDLNRARELAERGAISEAAHDRAETTARAADAILDTARAAITMREAELSNARAQLIGIEDQGLATAMRVGEGDAFPLLAPTTGRILQVIQQSETTLPVGAPIMEIGDVDSDLEALVELLSTDAVQVSAGDPVEIANWGGPDILNGVVRRIDPWGFTKYSALGVEEQRVNVVVDFTDPPAKRAALGHGYRVEARIVIWSRDNALTVPSNAIFRDGTGWAAFRVEDGRARHVPVEIGQNNGQKAEVLSGLAEGDAIILYPSATLGDGQAVAQRQLDG
ncbi:efflux RND transporter periplasmic adaptor subunit [Oceanomicrobium pacificus]|nr:HlyD family efflux transporter periplasmic adaptor subunit [Oceanomicrobium pacificus]